MASESSSPISHTRLKQIATDACNSAVSNVDFYDHTKVNAWNSLIISQQLVICMLVRDMPMLRRRRSCLWRFVSRDSPSPADCLQAGFGAQPLTLAPLAFSQNNILKNVITESTPQGTSPSHKYVVNSTIVQHLVPTSALNKPKGGSEAKEDGPYITTSADATATDGKPHVGRRGMHSATQAFWDQKNDGLWSFKYDGGEAKGMDVVVTVIWVAI
ncbi:Tctex-1 family-domain-containing protein [Microdochium bolleyi]|uniref:Tctex-1 family-domain-containing protein n=1 Tax=Microdochium bolleyi TaxID=196109 RepID=A0A136JD41_9PEZI|nr:Tctex-1 family-domain-containing protein [Microdochium bolleyi]